MRSCYVTSPITNHLQNYIDKCTKTKMNKEFQEGDYVGTRYRGGTREGIVENPNDDGKVVFTDQHGHKVCKFFYNCDFICRD